MATESCPASVLLIEDDERLRESITSFLEERDYVVECAEDGTHALELLRRVPRPCLVLVDLLMIRIDCAKLIEGLEREDRLATLPVVLFPVSAPDLFSRPAAVKKPVDLEILFRIVEEHCCGGNRGGKPTRDSRVGTP
jgi:CheY-like chemotaxis protein